MLKAAHDRVLRTKLKELLDVMATWFRDLLVVRTPGQLVNADFQEQLAETAKVYGEQAALAACETIDGLRRDMENNANLRLALEVLFIRLLQLRTQPAGSRA